MGIYRIKNIKESSANHHADDWEEDSNSELIGNDSDNLSELEQEKNKYDMMHHKQKRVADWKSEELFGKDNTERYNELKSKYLKNVDNFKDEYDDIEISSESSISSLSDFKLDTNDDNEYHRLDDDPNNENPDYDSQLLKNAIAWCNDTMITMILPTKTLQELEDLLIKWKSMTRKHQRDSDNKSIELFGMNNMDHYDYLKKKFIGTKDNDIYDTTTVLDVSNKAKELDKIKDDLIKKDELNESSLLDYGISLLKINNIVTDDTYSAIIKENTIKNIQYKINNRYDKSYNYIPAQLPYFTYDEIKIRIQDDIDFFYYGERNEGLNHDITLKKWLDSYSLLCKGIVDTNMEKFIPLWIDKVNELCIKLYKEKDPNKIIQIKENLLLLGWNPEIKFTYENRIKATTRCKSIISEYYKDSSINLSTLVQNIDNNTDIINEQENKEKLYPVYILLTYTSTPAGKVIKRYTDSIYTHAALSLDSSLQKLYSFNANVNGFSLESISKYTKYNPNSIMKLSCVFVKKIDLDIIQSKINDLLLNIKNTSYSFLNILGIAFNRSIQMNYSMVCSQFVDYIFKSIGADITNKANGLVTPKDFQILKNNRVYKLYEGKMINYDHIKINSMINVLTKKALYIKEDLNIINESQFINILFDNYNDINTVMYLDEKSNILNESNRLIYDKYIKPCIDPLYIKETKEFPVQFDNDGNLLIKNKKNINFEVEYSKSHKLLKLYDDSTNIEGMKYELAKLWFLNLLLEERIYINKDKKSGEYLKVRARILNDFNKYMKIIVKENKDFNFTEYYNNTPFSDETVKINNSTLKYSGELLKKILKHIIH